MSSNLNREFITSVAAGQPTPQKSNTRSHVIRRSKMETSIDVLRAISAGAQIPTHIMYKANLSWSVMQEYMKNLEVRGLVVATTSGRSGGLEYQLTPRGFQVVSQAELLREDLMLNLAE